MEPKQDKPRTALDAANEIERLLASIDGHLRVTVVVLLAIFGVLAVIMFNVAGSSVLSF